MSEFDPTRASMVHDSLNDWTFAWNPEWAASYRKFAFNHAPGVIRRDGLLLDGWSTADVSEIAARGREQSNSRTGT